MENTNQKTVEPNAKKMAYEMKEMMEGLVAERNREGFVENAAGMVANLKKEGFEKSDILVYLIGLLEEVLD